MIKYVKYAPLSETYAYIKKENELSDENKKLLFSIILFKLGRFINLSFKDYETFKKFRAEIQKNCILVDFHTDYDLLGLLKQGGFAEV